MENRKINLRLATHLVFAYMIFAFGWWAVHLWRQNDALFLAEKKLLETRFGGSTGGFNQTAFEATEEFKTLQKKFHSRHKMILGEGFFFTACLLFGLWALNRSANFEVKLAQRQRNFLLSITHELKSPLAGIRLSLETLERRAAQLSVEQSAKFCQNGLRETDRLQNLVNDILLAARLDEGWQPQIEPIDLRKLVEEILAGLAVRFPQTQVRIKISDDFPPVRADRNGLLAVVQNLLENALKYSPEGAEVVFSAEKISEKSATRRTRISVADNGMGIPDGEKQQIFEKFYRVGNELTRATKGTGLGLFIVRQVVSAHGGAVFVKNNQPRGSVFSVEI